MMTRRAKLIAYGLVSGLTLLCAATDAIAQELRFRPAASTGNVVCMPGEGECGDTEIIRSGGGVTVGDSQGCPCDASRADFTGPSGPECLSEPNGGFLAVNDLLALVLSKTICGLGSSVLLQLKKSYGTLTIPEPVSNAHILPTRAIISKHHFLNRSHKCCRNAKWHCKWSVSAGKSTQHGV